MELGARGGTDLEDVPLDRGILLVRLFPFPACRVCVSVSPRVRVCVYNNLSVCLREGRGGGEGLVPAPGSRGYLSVPLRNRCRPRIWGSREQRELGRPECRA